MALGWSYKRRFTGHGHGPLHPWKHGIGAAEVLGHGRGKFRTDAGQAKGVKEAAQGHPSGRVNLRHHVPCRGGAHALQGHQALRAQRIEVFEAGHQAMFEQLVHQLLSDAVHLECAAPVQHRPRGAGVAHEVITPQEGPVQAKHSATRRTIAWGRNRGRCRQLAFEGPSVGM